MNIFITGINGFVGSNLADYELSQGNRVIGLIQDINHKSRNDILSKCSIVYGDIRNSQLIDNIISKYEINVIYHLAAIPIVRICVKDPMNCITTNIIGTTNILESVRKINSSIKVIVASTDKAYGDHGRVKYIEDMKLIPGDIYSTAKACSDMLSISYANTYNIDIKILRSSNIYGPGDMNDSRLIPNTIKCILKGNNPQIYKGVLSYRREMIYIEDVCKAYHLLINNGRSGEIYNIGTEISYTIEEIVSKISTILNHYGVDIIEKTFPEIPEQMMDTQKIQNEIGWKHTIDIEEGLLRTIEWYRKHI